MTRIVTLLALTAFLAVLCPTTGYPGERTHCHEHRCDDRCKRGKHHSDHECNREHCDAKCPPQACPALGVAQYRLTAHHTYRLLASENGGAWRTWGILRLRTNAEVRVMVPVAEVRTVLWQVVDATPGFNQAAQPSIPADCRPLPLWVALGRGRVLQSR